MHFDTVIDVTKVFYQSRLLRRPLRPAQKTVPTKPLRELVIWGCEDARNYTVLTEIKTLELILLPATYRNLPAKDYEAIGALRELPHRHLAPRG
ncbi:MAG: hypothetical protein Q8K78_03950 [Planctomycetaceae bacterium]|nr:hypothetical protein [Planctomycetaceae bacterium]